MIGRAFATPDLPPLVHRVVILVLNDLYSIACYAA